MEIRVRLYLSKELDYFQDLAEVKINKRSVLSLFISHLIEELFLGVDKEVALGFIMEKARKKALHNIELKQSAQNIAKTILNLKTHLKTKSLAIQLAQTNNPNLQSEINQYSSKQCNLSVNNIFKNQSKSISNNNNKLENNLNTSNEDLPDLDDISW